MSYVCLLFIIKWRMRHWCVNKDILVFNQYVKPQNLGIEITCNFHSDRSTVIKIVYEWLAGIFFSRLHKCHNVLFFIVKISISLISNLVHFTELFLYLIAPMRFTLWIYFLLNNFIVKWEVGRIYLESIIFYAEEKKIFFSFASKHSENVTHL